VAGRRFVRTLDPGTRITIALNLLTDWDLLTKVPGAYRVTPVGAVAANSYFDLLQTRAAQAKVARATRTPDVAEIAQWLVEDFYADETKRARWSEAIGLWISEVEQSSIPLPEQYRGDFEQGLERLGDLANLYAEVAAQMGKTELAERCREAHGCITYGVHPDIVPIAALRIRRLGRARCRYLHDQKNICDLDGLAGADPRSLAGPRLPAAIVTQFVARAREIAEARKHIQVAEDPKTEVDSFLARFMVDRVVVTGGKTAGQRVVSR
jgi:hypothetical protein